MKYLHTFSLIRIILRVAGTALGGVLGIIVWKIVDGNPYGLVALTFVVMMPLYYYFFTGEVTKIVIIMIQVTLLLVSKQRKENGTA